MHTSPHFITHPNSNPRRILARGSYAGARATFDRQRRIMRAHGGEWERHDRSWVFPCAGDAVRAARQLRCEGFDVQCADTSTEDVRGWGMWDASSGGTPLCTGRVASASPNMQRIPRRLPRFRFHLRIKVGAVDIEVKR